MSADRSSWAVILAAGSGSRLSNLTTDADGRSIPKQFCSLAGGPSLLRRTILRMRRVVDPDRVVVVVSAAHRQWWAQEVVDFAPENVIVQPCNKGTACGVLLPLVTILHVDPFARVVVTPSDHHLVDESALESTMGAALAHVGAHPESLVLLGIEPDRAETEYGWITAEPFANDGIRVVTSFVEKPDSERARHLLESGALWSSFTFVASGEALMQQFRNAAGWLVDRMSLAFAFPASARADMIPRIYDGLPTLDFSRHILERSPSQLYVLSVPPCGWTDLGSPQRVVDCVRDGSGPPPSARRSRAHESSTRRNNPGRDNPSGWFPTAPFDLAQATWRRL